MVEITNLDIQSKIEIAHQGMKKIWDFTSSNIKQNDNR